MNLYSKVIEFVDHSFQGDQKEHFERTVYWFEIFLIDCEIDFKEVHKIAAYSHDIERAFRSKDDKAPNDYLNSNFLKHHQERGAEIMSEFLTNEGVDKESINKVYYLISRHEIGGDDEQNALMDADSVSFFETNAEMFVNKKAPTEGYIKVKTKLDWMFNRIKSEKAKEEARKDYEKWSKELEFYRNI